MKNLRRILFSASASLMLLSASAHAQTFGCPDGVANVVGFGANGTVAADTAAFSAAYTAVTTHGNPCEGDRIFVPAGNWAGHWPTFYTSVYVQGAGPSATNFMGDSTPWPVFWSFAPVTFDSFGFWGSPNVNIRLDSGTSTSVLENLLCRSSPGMFIYNVSNQDVHFENLESLTCGNAKSSPSWMGASVVLNSSNNIYMDSPVIMAGPNAAIVAINTPSVIIYGGAINNEFAYNLGISLIYGVQSSIWSSSFEIAGTSFYDVDVTGSYSAYLTTFGGGAKAVSAPGSATVLCNQCNFP